MSAPEQPAGTGALRIGIDTGGTFTDVVAVDTGSGRMVTGKTPSTPDNPARAFMKAIDRALESIGVGADGVGAVSHGTTVATNALLEDDFSGLGLLTTQGFRHVLEIARQSVPEGYGNSYFWLKPDRLVPLHLVREVPERLDASGAVLQPLDDDAVADAARWFAARGIHTVGVSLLHSYANPAHEQRVRDIFARVSPGCTVSISSDVLREYREYERAVTTLIDAFVKPRVGRYVASIRARLDRLDPGVPFYVMKSNGGVVSAAEAASRPITTILSGPAAGALGAAMIADACGFERVLTLDGGGTSTDVAVVTSGEPPLTTEGTVGRFPTKVPMVDVITVGTGGGSIAWVPRHEIPPALKVGPGSAGADPGPLCYARGGTEPTVTDAHLVLGRIPAHLLGGEIPLDAGAARRGLSALAERVGLDLIDCAAGVLEIAVWNQANAIRQVTVKRGLDVRDFTLTAFGGAGPLQACRLIDLLELPAALIPRSPGTVSAFGLLTVDVRNDDVQTLVCRHDLLAVDRLRQACAELERRAAKALTAEGFGEPEHVFVRQADLRYDGQASEVRVTAPGGAIDAEFADEVVRRFHDAHRAQYGYSYRDHPDHGVEWVNLRVAGVGPIPPPSLERLEPGDGDPARAHTGSRRVFLAGGWHQTPLYARERLSAGDTIGGPAVLEEFGSTLPLAPGFVARVDTFGNLVVTRSGAAP